MIDFLHLPPGMVPDDVMQQAEEKPWVPDTASPPSHPWEQLQVHACFHPMTREDSTRLLLWITAAGALLFGLLLLGVALL